MQDLVCDLLVVGGGAAGSRAAYEAKKAYPGLKVLLIVAGGFGTSGSTNLMASESLGINAPFNYMGDGDSPDVYYRDMLTTGGGLEDGALCRIIADEACARIDGLTALGLKFDEKDGRPLQVKLSGCTKARSLTCGGSTGKEMVRVLKAAMAASGVEVQENVRILDLAKDGNGRVCGAVASIRGEAAFIAARAVVLANGGAGRVFRHNVNPPTLEGDGWSMAYRAGAKLVNMEFFQVGPAIFNAPLKFIIHSHMWRLQPRLTNARGEEFLAKACPPGIDPAEVLNLKAMSYPFSVRTDAKVLDLAIFKEVMAGRGTPAGAVFFDVTHAGRETLEAKAPLTYQTLKKAGIDLAAQKIEVGLVVQNFNGGIRIDAEGFCGVEGLYAAGEVTGGVHGSDRPGGNNLTDTQIFGARAGRAAAEVASRGGSRRPAALPEVDLPALTPEEEKLLETSADLFYANLTVVRTKAGIERTLRFIEDHRGNRHPMIRNRLTVGEILATAALTREESRGTHYREDFPESDPAWVKRIYLQQSRDGRPQVKIGS